MGWRSPVDEEITSPPTQLSLEQIEDKAKASGLTKTIVCARAI